MFSLATRSQAWAGASRCFSSAAGRKTLGPRLPRDGESRISRSPVHAFHTRVSGGIIFRSSRTSRPSTAARGEPPAQDRRLIMYRRDGYHLHHEQHVLTALAPETCGVDILQKTSGVSSAGRMVHGARPRPARSSSSPARCSSTFIYPPEVKESTDVAHVAGRNWPGWVRSRAPS